MSDFAIRISRLTKDYEVYQRPIDLALEVLTRRPRHAVFRALDNISFDVRRGEVLGIIGPNGAGKSTLLKILCGVLDASDGSVEVSGRITAILELGLGFNPEYSGRENIFLSGLLYGMSKAEVNGKIDGIIAFSGLGEVIERPVKTYSSGMHSRLAFSIATAVDPDILIVDEALATGDAAFVQKCLRRIRELCSGGRTAILVSHGTGMLAQLCQRVVWMERGQVRQIGPAIQVVQAYDLAAHQSADSASWIEAVDDSLAGEPGDSVPHTPSIPTAPRASAEASTAVLARAGLMPVCADPRALENLSAQDRGPTFAGSPPTPVFEHDQKAGRQVFRRGPVFIERVELLSGEGNRTMRLTLLEPFALHVHYRVEGPLPEVTLGVALAVNNKHDLLPVAQFMTQNIRPFETRESYALAPDRFKAARRGVMILSFAQVTFRKGEYLLSLGLVPNEPASWIFYEYRHLYYEFSVDDAGMDVGAPILLTPVLSHAVVESEGPG